MTRRPAPHRLAMLLWSMLMLALPAIEAVADARLAAAADGAVAHVEDAPRGDCPRVHAHDCAICQHLATFPLPERDRSVQATSRHTAHAGDARARPFRAPWRASTRQRAPPTTS